MKGSYGATEVKEEDAMALLREAFPTCTADAMNFVLFSTSGIHGSYCTIEEVWEGHEKDDPGFEGHFDVTFILVQPRRVHMYYGNVLLESAEDVAWLQRLRASSHEAMAKIGLPEVPASPPPKNGGARKKEPAKKVAKKAVR